MRKTILLMGMSLDGFGVPQGWLPTASNADQGKEHVEDMWEQLKSIDTFLLGRVTYQLWKRHWPPQATNPSSSQFAKDFSRFVEEVKKVVFSKTLKSVSWKNSVLVMGNIPKEIAQLKQLPGKDMAIVGGPKLANSLGELGLIDDYQIWMHPVVLGKGTPLIGARKSRDQTMLETKTFESGGIRLHFRPTEK